MQTTLIKRCKYHTRILNNARVSSRIASVMALLYMPIVLGIGVKYGELPTHYTLVTESNNTSTLS